MKLLPLFPCHGQNARLLAARRDPLCARPATAQGVALVVTLILLAIITTLAIAFVALTHRETAAVASTSSTTDAELAAEAALERAKAEILAPFVRANNGTNGRMIVGPEMMVSVARDQDRLNSYGAYVDPSPPVYVNTNTAGGTGPLDERHFLDLNRNRYFDETGQVPITGNGKDASGRYSRAFPESDGWDATNFVVGDPQWIGALANPLRFHTNNNQYISRFAYLVLPAGRSLDLNAIHNQSIDVDMSAGFSGYFRNQGVGPWEMSLAAFLTDLNTNEWPATLNRYRFDPLAYDGTANSVASGVAFNDANELLAYRYTTNYPLLPNAQRNLGTGLELFPAVNATRVNARAPDLELASDTIDYYSRLPLGPTGDTDFAADAWPGARNLRNFGSIHDLWDPAKLPTANGVRSRLASASALGNSYDRYSYYRLLSQLGTDSREDDDKLNLNYVNVSSWKNPSFRLQSSDVVPWTNSTAAFVAEMGRSGPELFFLSAIRRMLTLDTNYWDYVPNPRGNPFDVDHPLRIPVYTNGSRFITAPNGAIVSGAIYSGRIHQIVQQAANLYDAIKGTNGVTPDYPTVFRPYFETVGNNVYLIDYKILSAAIPEKTITPAEVQALAGIVTNATSPGLLDLDRGEINGGTERLYYNVPMVVGARKGFPNFNEFASKTVVNADRRLRVRKPTGVTSLDRSQVEEELSFEIISQFDAEAWYSTLQANYPRPLSLYFNNSAMVTIRENSNVVARFLTGTNVTRGYPTLRANSPLSYFPSTGTTLAFSNRVYARVTNSLVDRGGITNDFAILITNQLRFFLVDDRRLVDAVTISTANEFFNVATNLTSPNKRTTVEEVRHLWSREAGPLRNRGGESQLRINLGEVAVPDTDWRNYARDIPNKFFSISNFVYQITNAYGSPVVLDAPFVAVKRMTQENYWRANDPLVHYTEEDLWRGMKVNNDALPDALILRLEGPNRESKPWPRGVEAADREEKDPRLRDPGVRASDNWNFPKSRLPSVGWIGRVHRGTPWQTIYLKSEGDTPGPLARLFAQNIGGTAASPGLEGQPRRASSTILAMRPSVDARLLDIFTTTVHPNAFRGRLSVNQTNLAAWSAVLSGVDLRLGQKRDNGGTDIWTGTNWIVEPAALDSRLITVVSNINRARLTAGREFRRLSDLVAIPSLSLESPYLTAQNFTPVQPEGQDRLTDADYERIPEQIFSLLKVGEPRFVIYSWGQSLKPAEYGVESRANGVYARGPSVETAGDLRGLVRNYQITGEMATRAVVRIGFDRLSSDPNSPLYDEFDYSRPHAVVESFNIVPPQ